MDGSTQVEAEGDIYNFNITFTGGILLCAIFVGFDPKLIWKKVWFIGSDHPSQIIFNKTVLFHSLEKIIMITWLSFNRVWLDKLVHLLG